MEHEMNQIYSSIIYYVLLVHKGCQESFGTGQISQALYSF